MRQEARNADRATLYGIEKARVLRTRILETDVRSPNVHKGAPRMASMMTSKGRITNPFEIREQLELR